MTMSMRLALTVLTTLALATRVHAGPKEEAAAHIERGTQAHAAGDYRGALVELQAAYKLDPQPELLYAIGQVYVKLDDCREAISYYERFLATKPDREAASEIDGAIAECKKRLPAAPAKPAEPPPKPPEPSSKPAEPPKPIEAPPSLQADVAAPWYKDKLGTGLVIGGVIAAVVGLAVYNSAVSDLDAAEAATRLDTYNQLVEDAHTKRTSSVILVGGGVALVGAGVARYLLRDRSRETRGIALAPTRGGGVVHWTVRF